MKRFLAIYTGSSEALARWQALPEQERAQHQAAAVSAWHRWAEQHRAAIVEDGGPLGRTKRVSREGVADIRNAMAAYTLVQAHSHEAAAELFRDHPHFTVFPGDGVEIMECLAIPGM
jgi:hypothetical protein